MLPLYHLHSCKTYNFLHLIRAITPRNAFPPTPFSREQLQSERARFFSPRAFQPLDALSFGKNFLKKTRFFLAFIFDCYYYSPIARKSQSFLFIFQQIANFFQQTGVRHGFLFHCRRFRRRFFRRNALFFHFLCFELRFPLF